MSEFATILDCIGKKPGMWFGHRASIHEVSAFITGFQHGQRVPPDPLNFDFFTRWVAAHYRVKDGARGGFTLILDRVDGDESQAADEFFRLLPLYVRDLNELGSDGVCAHYEKVMMEIQK